MAFYRCGSGGGTTGEDYICYFEATNAHIVNAKTFTHIRTSRTSTLEGITLSWPYPNTNPKTIKTTFDCKIRCWDSATSFQEISLSANTPYTLPNGETNGFTLVYKV